jgi:aromatic-amino-acid transaminase
VTNLIPAAQNRPGNDPIFALNAEAQRRAAAGEPVINATLGALMNDDGTLAVLPSVVEALARVPARKAAAYAPIAGEQGFLRAVIHDVFADPQLAEMTVAAATPGGTGALYEAITNFLEPGQALLTTDYYWGPYHTLATQAGRRIETFPMFAGGGFDLAALEAGVQRQVQQQGRVLLFLNTPCHNPTGYSLDDREWDAIAGIVQRAGERAPVTVLVDMAYARFAANPCDWTKHAGRMLSSATVLVAWSGSKSFAQYGARIGAVLATHRDADERKHLANAFSFGCRGTWSNCNHAGQVAVAELLTDPIHRTRIDAERHGLIRLLDERVAVWNREAGRAGLAYPRYEGGFFVSVFTHEPEAAAARLREDGVFVVPIGGPNGGALRVALCSTPARDVPRMVAAMARAVRQPSS